MIKTDIRKLSPAEQYELRKKIVHLRERGKSVHEVSESVGYCPTHISTIWQKYKKNGLDELKPQVRGPKHGNRKLSAEQEKIIIKLLIRKLPDALDLDFYLWSRAAIRLAILQKFNINLPLRTITNYLKRWDFTPQKPIKRADKHINKPYRAWLKEDYPSLVARSKKENFEIHWVDDTCLEGEEDDDIGVRNINMISAISNQGEIRFMLYRTPITEEIFTSFLERIVQDSKRKILLILYKHEIYQSDSIHSWLNQRRKKIDILYLETCY